MSRTLLSTFSRLVIMLAIVATFAACAAETTEELPGFVIHPDFQLELLAAEPLVMDPVELKFDAQGRAFVLEMPGYPLREAESRLVLLEDTDGDGQFDHRQLFADKLQLASSFMPYREGFLVAAPPDLLYIRDTDNDKIADDYQVIMSGFSTGNLQHNFNGLTYGLNNWIYAANGGNSGHPYFVKDSTIELNMRGDDFRFRLDPPALERVGESSGGYGLGFDQWGHMYETHNLEHVSHLVFENRYLEELPASRPHTLTLISDHDENGLARIYPIGEQESRVNHPEQSGYFSGSCGITFYGGGAFPDGFNDNLFVADVVLNLIHLDVLSPDGSAFKTSRMRDKVEFLASTDRAFRPVNLTTGPDGALYVLDMHRDVIEHPEWIPDEIEATLDLDAGKDQGRIYRIAPKGQQLKAPGPLSPEDPKGLIAALGHPNQWVRMTAQRLLVEAGDLARRADLEALLQNAASPLARLHAMWTLEGLGALSDELLTRALGDQEAGMRENALQIVESRLQENDAWVAELVKCLGDEHPRVRLQAALAISAVPDEASERSAATINEAFGELFRQQEAVDEWMILASGAAMRRNALPFLSDILEGNSLNEAQLQVAEILSRVIGKEQKVEQTLAFLQELQGKQGLSAEDKAVLVEGVADGWNWGSLDPAASAVIPVLQQLEAMGEVALMRATGKLRRVMALPVSEKVQASLVQARAEVLRNDLPVDRRLEWLELISLAEFADRKAVLYQLLDNRQPLALQKAALRQLWESNAPDVGPALVERWPTFGPEARKGAGDILLRKSFNHKVLMTALEEGAIKVGELNFDLERRRTLLFWSEPDIQERAQALFTDAGVVTRREAMDKMRPALQMNGTADKGRELYSTYCGSCHRYGDMGVDVGPVLTEISRKSKESLLHDILDPNAAVDTRYLNHRIETKAGEIYTGIVENETDTELNILMMGGQQQTIRKKEIKSFSSLGISLMPEGLEQGMSEQDMADLLAFLQQQAS